MSYCRNNQESDLYVIRSYNADGEEYFWCIDCPFEDGIETFSTRKELLDHLELHKEYGHKVPVRVFVRLRKEMGERNEI